MDWRIYHDEVPESARLHQDSYHMYRGTMPGYGFNTCGRIESTAEEHAVMYHGQPVSSNNLRLMQDLASLRTHVEIMDRHFRNMIIGLKEFAKNNNITNGCGDSLEDFIESFEVVEEYRN